MKHNPFLFLSLIYLLTNCGRLNSIHEKENQSNSDTTKNLSTIPQKSSELVTNPNKDYSTIGFDLMKNEFIGELSLGLSSQRVKEVLGKPEEESNIFFSEVDGTHNQTLNYIKLGIELNLIVDSDSVKTVSSILIKKPCPLKTLTKIGIGSTTEEVENAYKESINPEYTSPESIIAGTIYGGMVFSLQNKKVKTIYVGVSAE